MNRIHWLLTGVIALEVLFAAYLIGSRETHDRPPLPKTLHTDARTAAEIKDLAAAETPVEWEKLAEAYFSIGYYPEAEACYRHLTKTAPKNGRLRLRWAFSLASIGRLEEANEQFLHTIQLGSEAAADCWYFIGQNHLRLGNAGEADRAFSRSGHFTADYQRAHIAFSRGDVAASAKLLAKVLSADARYIEPYLLGQRIAEANDNLKDWIVHSDRWRYLVGILPTPVNSQRDRVMGESKRYGLGKVEDEAAELAAAGRRDEMVKILREALETEWDYDIARKLVEHQIRAGDTDEALRWLGKILKRDGRHYYLMVMFGRVYSRVDRDKAKQAFEHAAELPAYPSLWNDPLRPHRHELLRMLALLFEKDGDTKSRDRYKTLAQEAFGVFLLRYGDLQKAADTLQKAVEQNHPRARSYYYLGEALRRLGHHSKAKAAYHSCLKLDPHHGRAWATLQRIDNSTMDR